MKTWMLTLMLLAVLLSAAVAQESRTKRESEHPGSFADVVEEDEEPQQMGEEDGAEYSEETVDVAERERKHPCEWHKCRRGETCIMGNNRKAKCVCFPECQSPAPQDNRYEVCSRRNVTYHSECDLNRDHCLCRRRLEGCSQPGTGAVQLDYYGKCQELTPCTELELDNFPGRMREWLYIVMQQMAQKAEIPDYLELLEQARTESNHTHAVLWKFCDLDVDPHDRFVTHKELLYTIQSLKAMEHCLTPFLDHCDTDSNGKITLMEWGKCLGLEEGKIHDECTNIRNAGGRERK